jgi:hypothetical protein
MPFYFRKSVSAGPFRFNFSKGGVGASVGVKGFRVGTGPRGHYVHAGRGGIYYRATLGSGGKQYFAPVTEDIPPSPVVPTEDFGVSMVEVESSDVMSMRDVSFGELLDEINAKLQQPSMAIVLGWLTGAIGLLAMLVIGFGGIFVAVLALPAWALGNWLDSYRRTTVLFYDLAPEAEAAYGKMIDSFDAMASCVGKWHVEAGGAVLDLTTWKRNAGASHIVRKKPTQLSYKLPPAVTANITPPALHVGKQIIYFLPDVALVVDGKLAGAVGYGDLSIAFQDSNFIEEGAVPNDAQVIGQTWKHPNKSGGPDRRFKDNRQIPICRYEVMHLTSSSGVNELVEFSKTGVSSPFAQSLKALPRNTTQSSHPQLKA